MNAAIQIVKFLNQPGHHHADVFQIDAGIDLWVGGIAGNFTVQDQDAGCIGQFVAEKACCGKWNPTIDLQIQSAADPGITFQAKAARIDQGHLEFGDDQFLADQSRNHPVGSNQRDIFKQEVKCVQVHLRRGVGGVMDIPGCLHTAGQRTMKIRLTHSLEVAADLGVVKGQTGIEIPFFQVAGGVNVEIQIARDPGQHVVQAEGKVDIFDGPIVDDHIGDGQVAVDVRVGNGSLPGGIKVQHAFPGKNVLQPLDA